MQKWEHAQGCALCPIPVSAFCLAESIRFTFVQGGSVAPGKSRRFHRGVRWVDLLKMENHQYSLNIIGRHCSPKCRTHPKSMIFSLKHPHFLSAGDPDTRIAPPVESHFTRGVVRPHGHCDQCAAHLPRPASAACGLSMGVLT